MAGGKKRKADASHSSNKKLTVQGLCAPPVSVFNTNGAVNLDIIPSLVQHLLDFGISNAFVTGTNGEALHMSVEERKQVAEKWLVAAKGKLSKVIIHIGAGNLVDSQELARHAEQHGADAIACVGPTYFKPETMDCYLQYMAAVAGAAPKTPFVLYDIDFITGIKYDVTEFFSRGKSLIPTLAGVKHTSPDMVSINNVHVHHPDIELMLGSDELYLEALSIGVCGNITSTYMGNVHNRLIAAYQRGDMETARLEQSRCLAVRAIRGKLKLSIPGGTKAILRTLGLEVGDPRLPLASIPEETITKLKGELTAVGFYDWACTK